MILVFLVILVFLEYYVALGFYLYCLINLLVFLLALRPPENLVLSNMSKIVCNLCCLSGEYRGRTDDLLHAMQAL